LTVSLFERVSVSGDQSNARNADQETLVSIQLLIFMQIEANQNSQAQGEI
jgi:hypothetical protein